LKTMMLAVDDSFYPMLYALGRLNSWVRSGDRTASDAKEMVYNWKKKALDEAQNRGLTSYRPVARQVRCRECSGDGVHYVTGDECRTCEGSGKKSLFFIETTLSLPPNACFAVPSRLVWHTPCQQFPLAFPVGAFPEAKGMRDCVDDWMPNRRGVSLDPEGVARCLNAIETYFGPYTGEFSLWIGELPHNSCTICGCAPAIDQNAERAHTSWGLLREELLPMNAFAANVTWQWTGCGLCRIKHYRRDSLAPPWELRSPAIRRWMSNHPPSPLTRKNGAI
jgi:hypothetical protein